VVNHKGAIMKITFLAIGATAMAALPLTAHAQGVFIDDGPVYEEADTILGVEAWPRFREYVYREHRPSYRIREEVRVGAVLPQRGVTFYEVPREYLARPGYYSYAVVNDVPVIVEPRSRRIVEIIE
jgi:hypothetical protein